MLSNVHLAMEYFQKWTDKVTLDRWEVTPYGVSDASYGDYGCTIMAKIKKFHIPDDIPDRKLGGYELMGQDIPYDFDDDDDDEREELAAATLLGHFGRLYSALEWAGLTKHGCSNCSLDLLPEDHEEIWWVGEMQIDPLCESCCDYMTSSEDKMKETIQ